MRKSLISAGRMQSIIITSARACRLGALDTSYPSNLSLTDSNEKWSEKSIPSFSRWTLRSFWILLDAQVVLSSNVAEIIFSGALSFRNSFRSLLRRDEVATGLGALQLKPWLSPLLLFHQDYLEQYAGLYFRWFLRLGWCWIFGIY